MYALIEATRNLEFSAEIALVLSDRPDAAGLRAAREAGVTAEAVDFRRFQAKGEFEAAIQARLASDRVELVCLAGFMRILSPSFVERWRGRMLNIHPSLLPRLTRPAYA